MVCLHPINIHIRITLSSWGTDFVSNYDVCALMSLSWHAQLMKKTTYIYKLGVFIRPLVFF